MSKNPFPGMNPWLESHWGDVHTSLTTYARDQLQPQLPPGLRARVEEYVAVESEDEPERPKPRFSPDVRVIERPGVSAESGGVATAIALAAEPLVVPRRSDPETLRHIRIVDVSAGHRIVTSIEFLSPANKVTAAGRQQFRRKQKSLLAGGVNLVEIDLVREGAWVLAVRPMVVPKRYRRPYRVCVVRADRTSVAEVYRIELREPLPTIRIPLRSGDQDVPLQLQTLIDTAYVNGRYGDDIDYLEYLDPALTDSDAEWAERVLREQGLR